MVRKSDSQELTFMRLWKVIKKWWQYIIKNEIDHGNQKLDIFELFRQWDYETQDKKQILDTGRDWITLMPYDVCYII